MVLNTDPKMKKKASRITWNLDPKKVPRFLEVLKPKIDEWNSAYQQLYQDKANVNLLVEYFQLIIVESAREVFGFKVFNDNSVNWVDHKMHKLLKKKKKIANKISNFTRIMKKHYGDIKIASKSMKKKMKKYKHRLRKLQKKIKKNKYKNVIKSTENIEKILNNNSISKDKVFFNTVNKISNRQSTQIPPLRDPDSDEILAQTDEEIANILHLHYCKKLKRNKYNYEHQSFHNYVDNYVKDYKKNKNDDNSIVNRKFTNQEIMHVLTQINIQSAMAADFIHYQLIVWAKTVLITSLTLIFNLIYFIHQVCPQIWKYGEYVPVPKPGRAPYYCKNIRPIMILPGMGRIMGKLLCNRLLSDCIKRKLLTKNNCAFQCNRSTEDIVNNLTESIYQALQNLT